MDRKSAWRKISMHIFIFFARMPLSKYHFLTINNINTSWDVFSQITNRYSVSNQRSR